MSQGFLVASLKAAVRQELNMHVCSTEVLMLLRLFSLAGLQDAADEARQRYHAGSKAAAQDLQRAAEAGTHAAYLAAAATASRFSTLKGSCSTWATCFQRRQQGAVEALHAAVQAMPLPQVQSAVDAALALGVPGKQLAAALEAARARDFAAVGRLSAAVKALQQQSSVVLAQLCAGASASGAAVLAAPTVLAQGGGSSGTSTSSSSRGAEGSCFDLASFEDAVAACRQYGKAQEAAAAETVLQQCRQQAAVTLAEAAEACPSASQVHKLLSWERQIGGLEQDCTAAADRLAQRQQQLLAKLQQLVISLECDAAGVKLLLQQAEDLGVPAEALWPTQQHLQQQGAAAQQQCWEAARVGSLQELQQALAAAGRQGVGAESLQQCWALMQGRQEEAAGRLAGLAKGLCLALQADSCPLDAIQMVTGLLTTSDKGCAAGAPAAAAAFGCMKGSEAGVPQPQQREAAAAGGSLHSQMRALLQQAAACIRLGLQENVAAAVQAVAHAVHMKVVAGKLSWRGGVARTTVQTVKGSGNQRPVFVVHTRAHGFCLLSQGCPAPRPQALCVVKHCGCTRAGT